MGCLATGTGIPADGGTGEFEIGNCRCLEAETDCLSMPYKAGAAVPGCLATPRASVWPPGAHPIGPFRQTAGGSTIDPPIGLHPIRPSSASARTPLSSPATTLPRSSHPPRCGHRVRLMGPSASKHTLSATHVRTTPLASSALTRGRATAFRYSSHALPTLQGAAARGTARP